MKIFTSIEMQWDGTKYVVAKSEYFEYIGEVSQCCGATSAQNNILTSQQNLMNTASQQASQIFGSDSQVFNSLVNTFSPTVAAGPSQNGFSAQETANLNSQAITANGQAAKNAKQAAGESAAAQGGGNTVLPSGTTGATDANIDTAIAANTANQLSGITQAGYVQGNKNYDVAVRGLDAAPGVFNGAIGAIGAADAAGGAAAGTANQIASQQNSWVQGVTGALGGIAGAAVGGGGILSKEFSGGGGGGEFPSVFNGAQNTLPSGADPAYNFGSNPLPQGPMPSF